MSALTDTIWRRCQGAGGTGILNREERGPGERILTTEFLRPNGNLVGGVVAEIVNHRWVKGPKVMDLDPQGIHDQGTAPKNTSSSCSK